MEMLQMPCYRCHKKVWALKISAIEILEDGAAKIAPVEKEFDVFKTEPGFGDRFKGGEDDLGYFVLYEDGYQSWSPTEAFEDGYTRL